MKRITVNLLFKVLTLISALIIIQPAFSQPEFSYKRDWSLSAGAGPVFFIGNVPASKILLISDRNNEVGHAFGFSVNKRLGSVVSLRGSYNDGKAMGSNREVTRVFETKFRQMGLNARIDLSTLLFRFNSENRRGVVFVSAGAGYMKWQNNLSHLYSGEEMVPSRPLETESAVFPVGLGCVYKISHAWEISLETVFNMVASDDFDAMESDNNDRYNFTGLSLTYNFVRGKSRPKMKIVGADGSNRNTERFHNQNKVSEGNVKHHAGFEEDIMSLESVENKDPWEDVVFKVQILASKIRMNMARFARKHDISARIEENKVGDWFKYTIGEFPKYSRAKEYRNLLISRNNLTDAFVVVYRGEEQITLQELMRGKRSEPAREPIPEGVAGEGVTFSVQVLAARNLNISVEEFKAKYNIMEETRIRQFGDTYQLVSGNFTSYRDAKEFRRQLIAKGLADAFIVAYRNGNRISINNAFEAKKILHD